MRIAVFASGGGSNFKSILDATRTGELAADVVLCVSSRPDAGVVERARSAGIAVHVIPGDMSGNLAGLIRSLRIHDVDLIALAGFMLLIPPRLIRMFPDRILNIHPALLPDFGGKGMYGMRVHRAVIERGSLHSGATVHVVDEKYDTGPVVLQKKIDVLPGDSAEDLAARVLVVEHKIYPQALELFARGLIVFDGRKAIINQRPDTQS